MSRNNDIRRSMLTELLEGQQITARGKVAVVAPVSTLLIDGSRAYQEKRYGEALKFFTHAIDNLHDRKADLLHVYDLRSNAQIKLGKHEEALKDAKQMIRLDRMDHRGYVKCAQVEQLQGKHKEALRVCEHGLKSVPLHKDGYRVLERYRLRALETLKLKVVYERGTDPMVVLPNELLEIVLSYFHYQEHIGMMRVCKVWRDKLRTCDMITRTIDTRRSKSSLSYEQIKAAFARLGQRPKLIAIKSLNETAARFTSSELSRWIRWESLETLIIDEPKIQTLHIRWNKMPQLQNLRIECSREAKQDPLQVLGSCPNLQSASLRIHSIIPLFSNPSVCNTNLRRLVIDGKTTILTPVNLQSGCLFAALERLDLTNVTSDKDIDLTKYSNLKHLGISSCLLHENLRTPPGLESFTLRGKFANTYPRPEEIKMPASNLHAINVAGTESIKFLTYARGQGLSNAKLRDLTIADFLTFNNFAGRVWRNDLSMLQTYAGGVFDRVESLGLHDDNIADKDYEIVHHIFPHIQYLDIGAAQITDAFVGDLLRCPGSKITTILLRNCHSVPQKIVEWCAARNVQVSVVRDSYSSMTDQGRRIQYEG